MPLIYRITYLLGTVALVIVSFGIMSFDVSQKILVGLFIYIPVLWIFWILCVFFVREQMKIHHLLLLWGLIDVVILIFFISLSIRVEHWANSKGIDMVLLAIYFPVIVPIGLIGGLFTDLVQNNITYYFNLLLMQYGGAVGDAVVVWICFSLLAGLQSFIYVSLVRFFTHHVHHSIGE